MALCDVHFDSFSVRYLCYSRNCYTVVGLHISVTFAYSHICRMQKLKSVVAFGKRHILWRAVLIVGEQ